MQLFYEPEAKEGTFILNKDEAQHCINVLRKKTHDGITVVNGEGIYYACELLTDNVKKCQLKTISCSVEPKRAYKVHLAIAPTKNIARIEWLIEKVVEIGIDEISFIFCENSERRHLRMDRLTKKAISAMKQSLKATLPTINQPLPFSSFLKKVDEENRFIAYVDFTNTVHLKRALTPKKDCCIAIGPEGDFSSNEVTDSIENKFIKVSLGNSRLRTDTAGLMACHIAHIVND